MLGAYLEDPPRVVLIIHNATIAHTSLHNRRVKARVCVRRRASTSRLTGSDEAADGSVALVFFFDLAPALLPDKVEYTTGNRAKHNDADDNTRCNACCIRLLS